jgi:hypothetical protein
MWLLDPMEPGNEILLTSLSRNTIFNNVMVLWIKLLKQCAMFNANPTTNTQFNWYLSVLLGWA